MESLYVRIYCLPIPVTALALVALALVWYALRRRWPDPSPLRRLVLALTLAAWGAVILHMTVLSRTAGTPEAHWLPLRQLLLYLRGGDRELLRTMWMNGLLFVPGGLLLAALWPRAWGGGHRTVLTVAALALVSAALEWTQLRFGLGVAETDDVLCNALGALVGAAIHQAAVLEE